MAEETFLPYNYDINEKYKALERVPTSKRKKRGAVFIQLSKKNF